VASPALVLTGPTASGKTAVALLVASGPIVRVLFERGAFVAHDTLDRLGGIGVPTLVVAGELDLVTPPRYGRVVAERMSGLGIRHIYQGQDDKTDALARIQLATGLGDEALAYMGDDLPDAPVLARVGLALTPADAHPQVRRLAHWVVPHRGGAGAARAACELVLAAQGRLAAQHARFGIT